MNKVVAVAALAACVSANSAPEPGMRLIAFSPDAEDSRWLKEEEIVRLAYEDVGFVDITDNMDFSTVPIQTTRAANDSGIPPRPVQQTAVKRVIEEFACVSGDCTTDLWPMNNHLASYFNRYFSTQDSVDAVMWLSDQYVEAAGARLNVDITVDIHRHQWAQPSIIVKMIGATKPGEVIVLGGHIDSIAGNRGAEDLAPGFDDDASGSSTVWAVFKYLVESGYVPDRTVEFHAYAAEEVGLRGSADIARVYRAKGIDVVTMTQFDMTCYSPRKTIGLTEDFTDRELTQFLSLLLDEYTGIGGEPSICGYGCSDHASFTDNGYAAAFPFEAKFEDRNPFIHTTEDTVDKCDRDFMGEYVKLGLAYIMEMASL